MPDRALNLDACPIHDCDLDPTFAMKTTDSAKLTTQNLMSQGTVRACIAPTAMEVDGHQEPALYIVFHKVEEPEFVTAGELSEADDEPVEEAEDVPEAEALSATGPPEEGRPDPEADDEVDEDTGDDSDDSDSADASDDVADPSDLDGFERAIVEHVKKEGHAQRGGVQGAMLKRDKSPSEVKAALEWLTENGYLIEHEDAVYKVVGDGG